MPTFNLSLQALRGEILGPVAVDTDSSLGDEFIVPPQEILGMYTVHTRNSWWRRDFICVTTGLRGFRPCRIKMSMLTELLTQRDRPILHYIAKKARRHYYLTPVYGEKGGSECTS